MLADAAGEHYGVCAIERRKAGTDVFRDPVAEEVDGITAAQVTRPGSAEQVAQVVGEAGDTEQPLPR